MTGRFFSYRIFWKEYRQMRGFWLSVLGLAVMLQLIVYVASIGTDVGPLYSLAICFPALYALACGATAFAAEHENGTYDFLRALPVRGLQTFFSKVAFTLVSAPLLFLATWSSAALISSFHEFAIATSAEALLGWSIASAYLFIWATFFSLLLRHVVKAAILGGLAAAFSTALGASFAELPFDIPVHYALVSTVVGMAVLIVALDVLLGACWYLEADTGPTSDRQCRRRRAELDACTGAYELESLSSKGSTFGHLVWLQWRQSRGMILTLTALLTPFVLCLLLVGVFDSVPRLRRAIDPFLFFATVAAIVVVPLAGASVFAGDQRRFQFRFLTDRGLAPKTVWWSRHAVWVAAILVWVAIALSPLVLLGGGWLTSRPLESRWLIQLYAFPALLCVSLAYCFGQFCSMTFRSGIISGTFSIVGSALLALWVLAMWLLGVPLFWSVLPIPVILLVATGLRTRGWMLERNTIGGWLPVVLILAAPGAAILSGVGLYRAYSLPLVEPGFDVAAFTAPASSEAQETARMYRCAHDLTVGEASEGDKEKAQALILEASRRAQCDRLSKYFSQMHFMEDVQGLSALFRREGKRLQKEGNLDAAAEHHLAALRMANHMYLDASLQFNAENTELETLQDFSGWCNQPGQTKERILKALEKVEELTGRPAPWDNAIKAYYVRMHEIINGSLDDMFEWAGRREVAPALMICWMPWERERARRTLRWVTSSELQTYQRVQAALAHGYQVTVPPGYSENQRPSWLRMTPDAWVTSFPLEWASRELVATELFRRSTQIRMALAAWQLAHESLPESLEELKGEYLTEVPLDPYSGELFVYFPHGVSEPVKCNKLSDQATIEANKPFFWSSGPDLVVDRSDVPPTSKYRIRRGGETRQATSTQEIWASGRVFSIPQPR